MIECDVFVVGGGPAGLSVSESASDKGLDVVCVEKKEKIGTPVNCAEGVGKYLLEKLPFRFPKRLLEWEIDGLAFIVDEEQIFKKGENWEGYSISRNVAEPWLASRAQKKGAKILTGTEFLKVKKEKNKFVSTVKKDKKISKIKSNILVGADGVLSTVAIKLGIMEPKGYSPGYVYSWEVEGIELEHPECEYLFLGDFSPNGYGYIFPKSKNRANIGVGDLFGKKDIEKKFKKFLQHDILKKCMKNAHYVVEKSKEAPFETVRQICDNKVFFVGDSANQNIKPFIEGFLPAIICGHALGKNLHDFDASSYEQLILEILPEMEESKMLVDPMIEIFRRTDPERFHDLLDLMLSSLE